MLKEIMPDANFATFPNEPLHDLNQLDITPLASDAAMPPGMGVELLDFRVESDTLGSIGSPQPASDAGTACNCMPTRTCPSC